jgi:hypothetical protein
MTDKLNYEVAGSWICVIIGYVTAQDAAYVLASMVSIGAMIINFDRYVAAIKRMINKIKGEQS